VSQERLVRVTLSLVALAAAIYSLGVVMGVAISYADLILIFVLGWLMAFILHPLCMWVSQPHVPRRPPRGRRLMARTTAVLVVYVGLVLLTIALFTWAAPILIQQLRSLADSLPTLYARAEAAIATLQVALGLPPSPPSAMNESTVIQELSRFTNQLLVRLSEVVQSLASTFTSFILVVVFAVYLNLGGPELGGRLLRLLPKKHRTVAHLFMRELNRAFGGFLRGQVTYAAMSGAIALVALLVVQAPFVGAAALGAFVLSLIPLLGSFLGLIPPVLAGFLVSVKVGLLLLVVLGGIQLVLTNAVMPKIFGASIHLEPILVFIAIVVGIRLAGIWGAIFAIPLAALAVSMAQHLRHHRQQAQDQASA
jgi:predicted PurR-regulated permease PerM